MTSLPPRRSALALATILSIAFPVVAFAAPSTDGLWHDAPGEKALSPGNTAPKLRAFRIFRADGASLSARLLRAPMGIKGRPVDSKAMVTLPMPDGAYGLFAVERVELLAPNVQAQFPGIHTFRAQGLDDPLATARIELSPFGFRAYVMRDGDDAVIDPVGDSVHYRSFWKRDAERNGFACGVDEAAAAPTLAAQILGGGVRLPQSTVQKSRPNGADIRTYRFAAALTGEYTQFFAAASCPGGSPPTCPTDAAAAALTTTMNRVTGLLERDAAVSFNIVSTRIFTDPTTDPFSNGGKVDGTLLGDNQSALDANPGSGAYDIGHVFTAGSGGGLVQGRSCNNSNKARGGTGSGNPQGDPYDVDYVAHEVGHQLDGSHTWSSNVSNCTSGQFVSSSAYEPGSGSTIMSYAGICGGDDLQPHSDAYYHVRSIDQITDFRNNAGSGGSCGAVTGTGNTPPTVNAGADYTIPRDTPFVLTATGSDADGGGLTFAWEHYDAAGSQTSGMPSPAATSGPLFRSFNPTASASRTFPRIQAILGTGTSPWEVLPNVDRAMNFRVTARDNRLHGGGTDFDQMTVTVAGPPFFITAPDASSGLQCGAPDTLTWQVGGGNVAPTLRAEYSANDGAVFSTLIESTANDGSEPFTVPRPPTSNGRMRIAANGNIFFDISPRFSIVDTLAPTVVAPPPRTAECTSPAGTPVSLGTATTSDICDLSPSLSSNAPPLFPLGTTAVIWSSTDASGNTGTATQLVNIVDTTPPTFTLSLSADTLWPPNHRMVRITANIVVTEACDPDPQVRLVSITSNEPDEGLGDGDMPNDVQEAAFGTDDREFLLRAERSGLGSGRVYTVTYEVRDGSGNFTTRVATVRVPFSMKPN
jgi:hypothetical protein